MKSIKQTNILIVIGFQPYPTLFGGAVDIFERIVGIRRLFPSIVIDVVFTEKQTPNNHTLKAIKEYANNVYFVERKNKPTDLISNHPLQVVSRRNLKKITLTKKYKTVILEGEFVGSILENPTLTYDKLVIRIHNDEFLYFKELEKSSKNILKKTYYKIEAPKIKKYSASILNKADKLWYISSDEQMKSIHINKSVFLPPPINGTLIPFKEVKMNKVLFVGALFMPNNLYALDWFVHNIHPKLLKEPNYEFILVGGTKDQTEQDYITKKYGSIPNIRIHFNQKDLSQFYQESKVFINPMFHGSGVKIKSIQAISNGLPLVSTNIGSEGMNFTDQHFWRANTINEFHQQLKRVFEANSQELNKRVTAAQKHLEDNHYLKILKKELDSL